MSASTFSRCGSSESMFLQVAVELDTTLHAHSELGLLPRLQVFLELAEQELFDSLGVTGMDVGVDFEPAVRAGNGADVRMAFVINGAAVRALDGVREGHSNLHTPDARVLFS